MREVNWAVVHEAVRMYHDPNTDAGDFSKFVFTIPELDWWHGYCPLQEFITSNYPPEYAADERELEWPL